MRISTLLFLGLLMLTACVNENKELYKRVMDTHDEVMPRMGEIERLKRELRQQLANTPDIVVEKKQKIEQVISNLDSASRAMMNWMHKFNPLPDSANQNDAKAYLLEEMERIEKVKQTMLLAIDEAKKIQEE